MNQSVTIAQDKLVRTQILARQLAVKGMIAKQGLNYEGCLAQHVGCALEEHLMQNPTSQEDTDAIVLELNRLGFSW